MNKCIILVRDNDDYEFIYGALVLKDNVFDMSLFQTRLYETRKRLGYDDYNGDDIVRETIKKYNYKNVEFIPYGDYSVEV